MLKWSTLYDRQFSLCVRCLLTERNFFVPGALRYDRMTGAVKSCLFGDQQTTQRSDAGVQRQQADFIYRCYRLKAVLPHT